MKTTTKFWIGMACGMMIGFACMILTRSLIGMVLGSFLGTLATRAILDVRKESWEALLIRVSSDYRFQKRMEALSKMLEASSNGLQLAMQQCHEMKINPLCPIEEFTREADRLHKEWEKWNEVYEGLR